MMLEKLGDCFSGVKLLMTGAAVEGMVWLGFAIV
jgi:hypothetical protein